MNKSVNEFISLNLNSKILMKIKKEVVDGVNAKIKAEGDAMIEAYPKLAGNINTDSIMWKIDESGYVEVTFHEAMYRIGDQLHVGSEIFIGNAEIVIKNDPSMVKFNFDKDQKIVHFVDNEVSLSSEDGSIRADNHRNLDFYNRVLKDTIDLISNNPFSSEYGHNLFFTPFIKNKDNFYLDEFENGKKFINKVLTDNLQELHFTYHCIEINLDEYIDKNSPLMRSFITTNYEELLHVLADIYSRASSLGNPMSGSVKRLMTSVGDDLISIYSYNPETKLLRLLLNDDATRRLKKVLNNGENNDLS